MANKITIEYYGNHLKQLQERSNYPAADTTPLTEKDIKGLQPGTPCYIVSGAGLNLSMFAYCWEEKDEIHVYNRLGDVRYKLKNISKTYNMYKAVLG